MRRQFDVIAVAALLALVAFKLIAGPGKMVTESAATPGHRSIFGLHVAQPRTMNEFPVEVALP
jgi:hypothetical protein